MAAQTVVDGSPRQRKPFVKPDLFPDLEAFFAAERAALNQAMDVSVSESVCVPGVVESVREACLREWVGAE